MSARGVAINPLLAQLSVRNCPHRGAVRITEREKRNIGTIETNMIVYKCPLVTHRSPFFPFKQHIRHVHCCATTGINAAM